MQRLLIEMIDSVWMVVGGGQVCGSIGNKKWDSLLSSRYFFYTSAICQPVPNGNAVGKMNTTWHKSNCSIVFTAKFTYGN
jgi:hypothetical protein